MALTLLLSTFCCWARDDMQKERPTSTRRDQAIDCSAELVSD